ncbi:S41 family peptidase [Aliidiomarina sanyensis]|uniref:Tail specific protease domain-containing protein n=1 Tax=Aliidiomarina sanyensis TaxID=1249555 RepID=A0A432WPW3_9GAMM|nr:S41 family peptidase [Aliidiomarina sanyensis]RUO35717.1 hypothetical protein CWE11_02860 [Aliidiomarina sanyensis]
MKFLLTLLLTASFAAYSADQITEFYIGDDGRLINWRVSDDRAVTLDSAIRYEEQVSIRLDNDRFRASTNHVLRSFPLNFEAETIELRAKLKTKGTGAYAGANIFLRQDISRNAIEFSNSQPFVSANDDEWHAVRVAQVINPHADSIVIGAFLSGPGTAWVTDVQLWVDGKQLSELPNTELASTVSSARNMNDLQELSVNWQELNEDTINNLVRWMKVWGFLKYFHPEVAQGNFDWDLVFIEVTRSLVLGEALNQSINAVLDDISAPNTLTSSNTDLESRSTLESAPSWYLTDTTYSRDIVAALEALRLNRHSFNDSVYAFSDQMALPEFAREKQLSSEHLPNEIRLLMLARLWNVLEYWFPYREEIQSDWYAVLNQLTAKTLQNHSEFEFKKILQVLLAQLDDGHAGLSEAIFKKGSCYLPFTVRHIDTDIVISRIHKDLPTKNVQVGDRIVAIDEQYIHDLIEEQTPYHSASNETHGYYSIANGLMARSCEEATLLSLSRAEEHHQVAISNYGVPEPAHSVPGEVVQTLEGNVIYLKVSGVDFDMVDRALELSSETGKLIIDVRGYPSAFILYYLGNRLAKEPQKFARLARVDPASPGRVTMLEHISTLTPEDSIELDGIAILVDEASISQSEFSVMAWRELPNATVIGSTTAGAVGNVRLVPLMDGISAYFTGLRVYDKNGNDVQNIGIVPDIYVRPTQSDIREERDVVLERALEILNDFKPN